MSTATKQTEERINQIIADELGCDESDVTPNARFIDDLGADSLDLIELVMRFEEEFEIEIPDEDAEKVMFGNAAVSEAHNYINRKLEKQKQK